MGELPEYWLGGPIARIPLLLQPVAHSLLQSGDDVVFALRGFPDELLWERPFGVASIGFHLQHMAGVLDRMGTYASGNALSELQFDALSKEGEKILTSTEKLIIAYKNQISTILHQLIATDVLTLTNVRFVGRARIASTVIGILFHSAEHAQRHTGQLIVTAKLLYKN
ncbi:MAG: hypothetical protein NVS1B13_16100 [Flavisolibacter sp.]